MHTTIQSAKGKVKIRSGPTKPPRVRLKQRLAKRGITYQQVGDRAGVGWHFVWAVLNGYRTSAKVVHAAQMLIEETAA